MVAFAKEYPDLSIVQQAAAQIPWGHNMLLLDRLSNLGTRIWYIQKTIENGWSRSVLLHWIDSDFHKRQAKTVTNFKTTLTPTHSDLAQHKDRRILNLKP